VFAYVAALPRIADPDLRVLVMQVAASEAEHLAALRLAAGEEPVPDAFAGFTEAPAR
jgi:rubrerythrin